MRTVWIWVHGMSLREDRPQPAWLGVEPEAFSFHLGFPPATFFNKQRKVMPAPTNPAEQAVVDGANAYLDEYHGNNKFINDIIGKRNRIQGFQLSVRQAEVVTKIADEEYAKQQHADEEPF